MKTRQMPTSFDSDPIFMPYQCGILDPRPRWAVAREHWHAYHIRVRFRVYWRTYHVSAHYAWERTFRPRHVPGLW